MNITFLSILTDAFFIALLTWCSVTDLKKREIPNTAILLIMALSIAHLISITIQGLPWYEYPLGVLFAVPFFFAWRKGLMGGGDVKLLFVTGLYLGTYLMLISLTGMLAVCIGLLIWRAVHRNGIRVRLPLAPVLSLGAVATVILSYLF